MTPTANTKKLTALIGAVAVSALLVVVPRFEGTIDHSYRDPIGIITACTGHVDSTLRLGQTFTSEQCDEMLAGDLVTAAKGVVDCVHVPLSDSEFAAYTSFTFNVGVKAFCGSTAARLLNVNRHDLACAELSKWDKAGGRVLPGLTRRRAAERALCEGKP